MDEVELVVKGHIDELRMQRTFTYWKVLSAATMKSPPSEIEMFPLPYDDELIEENKVEDWIEFYHNATK